MTGSPKNTGAVSYRFKLRIDPLILVAVAWFVFFHSEIVPLTLLPSSPLGSQVGQLSLSQQNKSGILRLAYGVAACELGLSVCPAPVQEDLHTIVPNYDEVFVTLYDGRGSLIDCRGASSRDGIAAGIQRVVKEAVHAPRHENLQKSSGLYGIRIVVTFLLNRQEARWKTVSHLKHFIEPGVHAIEVKRGNKRAIFLESVPIKNNYSLEQALEHLSRKAGLQPKGYRDWLTRVFYYNTVTFTGTVEGEVTDLYHYNPLVSPESITPEALIERIDLAGGWFRRNINPKTGLLEYVYDPGQDKYLDGDNHIRRLASLWAVGTHARFADARSAYERIVITGLEYYLKFAKSDGRGGLYLDINGQTEIASAAFAILTLIEWPDYPGREQWIRQFADGIVHQQERRGAYRTLVGRSGIRKGIEYYPGEAMLALMETYREFKDPTYLASVERAFPFYQTCWRKERSTAFVPWHSQADLLLYQATGKGEYASFVFELNDWLIERQQPSVWSSEDSKGGFLSGADSPPGNSTASYLEGLNAAFRLAKLAGDRQRMHKYKLSIRAGTRCLLQMQYTKHNSFYLKNQERTLGGFTASLTNMTQRNDFTQHAIRALMAAYQNRIF
jgi:AMMECR1 domain-containing protein